MRILSTPRNIARIKARRKAKSNGIGEVTYELHHNYPDLCGHHNFRIVLKNKKTGIVVYDKSVSLPDDPSMITRDLARAHHNDLVKMVPSIIAEYKREKARRLSWCLNTEEETR